MLNIGDVGSFQTFVRLCAGRTSAHVDSSSLDGDAGISQPISRSWLSALEAGVLVFLLRSYLPNSNPSQHIRGSPPAGFSLPEATLAAANQTEQGIGAPLAHGLAA